MAESSETLLFRPPCDLINAAKPAMKPSGFGAFLIFVADVGVASYLIASPAPVNGGTGGYTTDPVLSSAGPAPSTSTPTQAAPSSSSSSEPSAPTDSSGTEKTGAANSGADNSDVDDDSLYRSSTKDSLGSSASLSKNEGALHEKRRPREKVTEVDSLKNLPRGTSDPKFQGSLLHSSVDSIESVSLRAGNARQERNEAAGNARQERNEDPRFKTKDLSFKKESTEQKQVAPRASFNQQSANAPAASPIPRATVPPGSNSISNVTLSLEMDPVPTPTVSAKH
jgi:hypothetical protein